MGYQNKKIPRPRRSSEGKLKTTKLSGYWIMLNLSDIND